MSHLELLKEYNALPPNYQREVEDFVLLLKAKNATPKSQNENVRSFGSGKHIFGEMSDDFNEPLEDFADYM